MNTVALRAMAAFIAIVAIVAAGAVSAQVFPSPHQHAAAEKNTSQPETGQQGGGDGMFPDKQPVEGDTTGGVVTGNNRFACDLYRHLANDSGADNLFLSPYSISSALAITCEGARGTTADEIQAVLHLPANATLRREEFARIDAALKSGDANCTLQTANALWAEKAYPFLPEYIALAERWYSANATNLDFVGAPDASRQTINRWVEERTGGKIRDLLPPGAVGPLTRLVVTNAIYFKGAWADPFDANKTREEEFRVAENETVTVPMMQRTGEDAVYPYAETAALQVLELPYAHEKNRRGLSMLVLLPKNGSLAAAGEVLDAQNLSTLRRSLARERVDVYLPKFTLEGEYYLRPTLAAMGMPAAFSPGADLSGMDGTKDLVISDVVHKAFVDVNEEGTEASAATGVVVAPGAAPPDEGIPVFRADHPFVFLILDNDTGNILFMGRVVRPVTA